MPSEIHVDTIGGNSPVGSAVSFVNGLTVATGFALTCNGNVSVSSTVTAGSFIGDGASITNLNGTTKPKAFSYALLF